MKHDTPKTIAAPVRSTQLDFLPEGTFPNQEVELLYYKQEYQRLKAIIALQKKKIKKLLG
ncbi:MAG: hypothetical protein AB7U59_10215 [Desulfovibrionaceae bacterium]